MCPVFAGISAISAFSRRSKRVRLQSGFRSERAPCDPVDFRALDGTNWRIVVFSQHVLQFNNGCRKITTNTAHLPMRATATDSQSVAVLILGLSCRDSNLWIAGNKKARRQSGFSLRLELNLNRCSLERASLHGSPIMSSPSFSPLGFSQLQLYLPASHLAEPGPT